METHTTPNATMRRYPGAEVALWRTEMAPGAAGPVHAVQCEHTIAVAEGVLEATIEGRVQVIEADGAITIPAGAVRRLGNPGSGPLVTYTASLPGSLARVGDAEPVVVPWAS